MSAYLHHIGIDTSKDSFNAAVFTSPAEAGFDLGSFRNDPEGISLFCKHLNSEGILSETAIFCIEATGVYSEHLCHALHKAGYKVCLEAPLKVKRSFAIKSHKTDTIDARQIAEYAFRFCDRMNIWEPIPKIINDIDCWLALREQLVKQQTAMRNFDKCMNKKVVFPARIFQKIQKMLQILKQEIAVTENKINELIRKERKLAQQVELLDSIPGIGKLTAVNLIVLMRKYPQLTHYRKAAAYIGICPYQRESGTSVRKPARISHFGPPRIRKLLHLCARSVCTHKDKYRSYYLRKLQQGKAKKLVINNVANKLLRTACAMINSNKPYIENYVSIHPKFN